MVKTAQAVAAAINAAGGVRGRQIVLVSEDDETNPDAGVRAARKLIDVDRVCAVAGTWASAVTTAVAPLCWQAKVMLFTVSGADSITKLPAQGYIIRTQPNTYLQMTRGGGFMLSQGSKRVFVLSAQTPFAVDSYTRLTDVLKAGGGEAVGHVIYDAAKTSFRSEVDQALKAKPDTIFLNSYLPDVTILLRELYQAGFEGKPPAVTEGLTTLAPSPDIDSPAYKAVQGILGVAEPDPYSCQIYDHISLIALAAAKGGAPTGEAIHESVRAISQGNGEKVGSAVEGLKLLGEGREINYEGASGPCEFTPIGDIVGCKFRFEQAVGGKFQVLSVS
jgi:branched-chain amino acid transport system substrate-binding protein